MRAVRSPSVVKRQPVVWRKPKIALATAGSGSNERKLATSFPRTQER
jgi:hypothetical protein